MSTIYGRLLFAAMGAALLSVTSSAGAAQTFAIPKPGVAPLGQVVSGSDPGYEFTVLNFGLGGAIVGSTVNGPGVVGQSPNSVGVGGRSTNSFGVEGISSYSYGGLFGGGTVGVGATSPTFPFFAFTPAGNAVFFVTSNGEVFSAGGYGILTQTRQGRTAQAFTASTTTKTLEETGTAQLTNGAAAVQMEANFAETIDSTSGYQVFLTPNGDSKGLYVAQKGGSSFVVRESQGGRSTIAFDYRIVAHPYGTPKNHMTVRGTMRDFSVPRAPTMTKLPEVMK